MKPQPRSIIQEQLAVHVSLQGGTIFLSEHMYNHLRPTQLAGLNTWLGLYKLKKHLNRETTKSR